MNSNLSTALLEMSAEISAGRATPSTFFPIRTWSDWAAWANSPKRHGMLEASIQANDTRPVIPHGHTLYRRDPLCTIDFAGRHDATVCHALVARENVGTAPLFVGTVPCFGRLPYRRADEIPQTGGNTGLGGQPFFGGSGRMASIWGSFGGAPRWAQWWDDGREDDAIWLQSAVDSGERPGWKNNTKQGAKRIQGRVILGRNTDRTPYRFYQPLNLDLRYMEIFGHGTGRDNVVVQWTGEVPEGWPRTMCVFNGLTRKDEIKGSAGFLRKFCNITILGPTREDETRIGDETSLFEAYDRCDEFSAMTDLEIMRAGTHTIRLQSANGMNIERIHWSVADQVPYEERDLIPEARQWCEGQTFLNVRGGVKWGQGTGGSGQLVVRDVYTNSDGATIFHIEENGHLSASEIDIEGAGRALRQGGNATYVYIRGLHRARMSRQYSDFQQGSQPMALIEIYQTIGIKSSSTTIDFLTHSPDDRKIYDHTAELLKLNPNIEPWLWSAAEYSKETNGINHFSRRIGNNNLGYGETNTGQRYAPIKEPTTGVYYSGKLDLA